MKKALALLLALVMVISMAACGSKTTPSTTAATTPAPAGNETEAQVEASELKVGVFYYTFADTYISSVRTALDAQLDSLGVTYNNFDGNNNQTTQNEQIQTAVTDGYNLLVVNMVTSGSPDVANEIISLANGTPVIFFNRAIEADGEEGTVLNANTNICFIGTDAPEAGHLQGKMVGEYLLANWDTVDLNGDGKISYAMFKGDEANSNMIELIICNNDNMAEGAISALEAAGYNTGAEGATTIPVFGVDATDAAKELIAAGKMTGTVKQDAEGMAVAIASVVKAAGEGTAMADAIAATAGTNAEMYSIADGIANKLFVAYAAYTK